MNKLFAFCLWSCCTLAMAQSADELINKSKNTENVTTQGMGYDLKNFVEPKLRCRAVNDLELPDCHLGFYDSLVVFDHQLGQTWIVATGLAADGHRTAVDLADAGNVGRGRKRQQIAGVIVFRTAGQLADFLKGFCVEQAIDTLANRQLAGGMMARHRFGAAALLGEHATALDFFNLCGPAHGTPGMPRQADSAGQSCRKTRRKRTSILAPALFCCQ